MTVYVENCKEVKKKKFLELISNFSRVARYKVNIQKLITFLYTGNEKLNFEIKKKNTIYNNTTQIKCLGKNLTKYV